MTPTTTAAALDSVEKSSGFFAELISMVGCVNESLHREVRLSRGGGLGKEIDRDW